MTTRTRQAKYRETQAALGLIQVSGWVHAHQAAIVTELLRRLRADGELDPGPVRNTRTGKLEKLEKR